MPAPRTPTAGSRPKILGVSLPVLAGGGIGLICLLGVGIFAISRLFGGGLGAAAATATEESIAVVVNTEAPAETATPEPTATLTPEPTEIPTETPVPATQTPEGPYVTITGIRLDNNVYVVDYEVHNFPESPQLHVHMFFDTVPPE